MRKKAHIFIIAFILIISGVVLSTIAEPKVKSSSERPVTRPTVSPTASPSPAPTAEPDEPPNPTPKPSATPTIPAP